MLWKCTHCVWAAHTRCTREAVHTAAREGTVGRSVAVGNAGRSSEGRHLAASRVADRRHSVGRGIPGGRIGERKAAVGVVVEVRRSVCGLGAGLEVVVQESRYERREWSFGFGSVLGALCVCYASREKRRLHRTSTILRARKQKQAAINK